MLDWFKEEFIRVSGEELPFRAACREVGEEWRLYMDKDVPLTNGDIIRRVRDGRQAVIRLTEESVNVSFSMNLKRLYARVEG